MVPNEAMLFQLEIQWLFINVWQWIRIHSCRTTTKTDSIYKPTWPRRDEERIPASEEATDARILQPSLLRQPVKMCNAFILGQSFAYYIGRLKLNLDEQVIEPAISYKLHQFGRTHDADLHQQICKAGSLFGTCFRVIVSRSGIKEASLSCMVPQFSNIRDLESKYR